MNTLGRLRLLLPVALLPVALGCTNSYGKFSFGTAQGGSSGAAGAGGSSGAAGAGGSSGAAGAGGSTSCAPTENLCGGRCVSSSDPANCGGCNNNCSAQGGLQCNAGVCGCASNNQCGQSFSAACRQGLCECNRQRCNPGENCAGNGNSVFCSCNGGAPCMGGQTCCQTPAGCFDLQTDPQHCGGCGHACAPGQACNNGVCG